MAQKVTSTDIKLALKEFHNGKPIYFITECKTCSTYFPDPQGLLKFDGLAITKSYTKPNIIGYEIKVSRNDFLQDNKWHLYLQYCNEFYFVVPKGLVKKEELPDHVGLIYFNPDTKGLRTVKKALYRQIEEPVGVYKYIIFSRLEEDRIPFYNDRAEYCKDYLEDKVVKSAILDYMNSKISTDPNVVALYTKMDKLCEGLSDEVVLKVTHGEHRVKRSWNRNFEYVLDVGIPKINPKYIGTYDTNLHEEMHFLDMLITVKDNKDRLPSKMFSQSYKPLVEAFDKATPVIGDKAKKLFEDFAKECDIIYKKQQETFNTQHEDLKEQYRSGKIDWKKYNSLYKKLSKEVNEEADNERRALFGGGVSGLQDIYDAVSKGTFRDTGQVTYGHGSAYYTDRRRTNPNCSESLANYASLCVGHPELIDILAEDYPEIVTALRGCVEAMLKEVPK